MPDFKYAKKMPSTHYLDNEIRRQRKKTVKKNGNPEKLVERECMKWFRENNFSMNVVESKAVYNPQAGKYLKGQTDPGVLDSFGNDINGHAIFVEFKAKGKSANLSPAQYEFMIEKIDSNAFCCVTDSAVRLEEIYKYWRTLASSGQSVEAMDYLRKMIPDSCHKKFHNELNFDEIF